MSTLGPRMQQKPARLHLQMHPEKRAGQQAVRQGITERRLGKGTRTWHSLR